MKRLGVHVTLALLPATAVLGFAGLALTASLVTLTIFQAAFSAVQRSLTRPARETLFTVVSREDKYKSKAVIDTFAWRAGDVVGAGVDGMLASLGMGLMAMAAVTIPLAVLWTGLAIGLGRAQGRLASGRHGPDPGPSGLPDPAAAD
jgi:AAA family ATP:ADP antiporter